MGAPETKMANNRTFENALAHMREGFCVSRAGWNGKGMWIAIQHPDQHSEMPLPYARMTKSYIYMRTAQGDLVPWLASQADLLADDWILSRTLPHEIGNGPLNLPEAP